MSLSIALSSEHAHWSQSYKFANFLLKAGYTVYWSTEPFKGAGRAGVETAFDRGTFLITEEPTQSSTDWIAVGQQRFGVEPQHLSASRGFVGLRLQPLRIAMYGGGGAPFNHARIFAELGFFVDFISPREIRQGKLADFDIMVMPGGGGIAMKGQLDPLGDEGCRMIAEFVQRGGMYMGSCAGSFDAAIVSDSFLAVCPMQRNLQLVNSIIWNRNDTEWVGLNSPGVGVLESQNLRPDHPVMFGLPDRFQITHYNGPLFEPRPGAIPHASESIGLSAVVGFTKDFTPAEYFLNIDGYDHAAAKDTTLIGRAAQEKRLNIIAGFNGMGRVVLFGSHPEFGYNLAMDRWDIPARMLANAAFWQAGHLAAPRPMLRKALQGSAYSVPLGSGPRLVAERTDAIMGVVSRLKRLEVHKSAGLTNALAMSTFGLSGEKIWAQNLIAFDELAGQIATTTGQIALMVDKITAILPELNASGGGLQGALQDALLGLEEAVHYRTPPEWNQDFGFEGVLQMLDRTESMLRKAEANFTQAFAPNANPYQYFDSSPFQLAVGSYLAAIGVFGNAWMLLQVHNVRLEELVVRASALHAEPV